MNWNPLKPFRDYFAQRNPDCNFFFLYSDEPVYPHLKSLLQFDTREFFNVLALAFEEPEFNSPDG